LHSPWIKPSVPNNFDSNRAQGCTFLTSCKLYLSFIGLDFLDDQTHIHWALSYFKSGCVATFAECVVRQEMKSGEMIFADWNEFCSEFTLTFCPENKVMTALM
jgi:hypothetical protein